MSSRRPLRRYQKRAVEAVVRTFSGPKRNARGILHMACGTGKTVVSLRIWESLDIETVLFLVPTLNLLRQTMLEWETHRSLPYEQIVVCSDTTILDGLQEDARDLGLEATSDPTQVASFLKNRGRRAVFCTYQSLPVIAQATKGTVVFDLVVLDEAHRTATGGKRGEGLFKMALDNDIVASRRRLFMTATPRVFSKRAQSRALRVGYDVSSMDDRKRYGHVIFRFSFAEAIGKRVLSDYQVLVMAVRNTEIDHAVRTREFVNQAGEAVDAETVAKHIAVAKAIKKHKLRKLLVFHRLIEDARKFSDPDDRNSFFATMRATGLLEAEKLWVDYVSGSMSVRRRAERLATLRDSKQISLLANAKCLTEGIDVPALDAVVFMHPKTSTIDIAQAVGRALRLPPDFSGSIIPKGYVIIPLIINQGDDVDAILDDSAFHVAAAVLRQMRSHDEELGDVIDTIRVSMGERLPSGMYGPNFEVPKLSVEDIPEYLTASNFKAAVVSRLVELSHDPWEVHFKQLVQFHKRHGHCSPPGNLGGWLTRQRNQLRSGKLDGERRRKLNTLGFSWNPVEKASVTIAGILEDARSFHDRFGRLPSAHTRDAADGSSLTRRWSRYDHYLRRQHGLTLDGLLKRDGLKEDPALTRLIVETSLSHYEEHGQLPTRETMPDWSFFESHLRRHKGMEAHDFLRLQGVGPRTKKNQG